MMRVLNIIVLAFILLSFTCGASYSLDLSSDSAPAKKTVRAWAMKEKAFVSPGQDYIITINRMPVDRKSSNLQYCEVFFGNKSNRFMQLIDDFMLWNGNADVIFSPSGSRFALNIQETSDTKNFKLYEVPGRMTREIPVTFPRLDHLTGGGTFDSLQMSALKWIDNDRISVQLRAWRGLPSKKPDLYKNYVYSVGRGYTEQ